MKYDSELFIKALGKNEGRIYTILLNNQGLNMMSISILTGMPRTSCYRDVRSLIKKGLVHYEQRKSENNYYANSPEVIIESINRLIRSLKAVKNSIRDSLEMP